MHPPESAHEATPLALPAFAWFVGLLALPWLLHAGLVLASSLGAHPLSGPAPAWLLIAASLAGAVLLGIFARRHGGPPPPSAAKTAPHARALAWALQIGAGVAFVYPLVAAAFLPIIAYDAIAYRLPALAQWLDAGRVAWVVSDDPVRNGYPLGQEAVSALIAAASGSLRFAAMTSYLYVAAAALAIVWLARSCDVRASMARAAAASFLLVPMLILNAPSGYVDAAFASACVCLFCSAALAFAPGASAWIGFAAGMSAAHVIALKGTGLPFVVLVVGLCFLRVLLRRRAPSLAGVGLFALGTAPGCFWPLRNLVYTGNPLYPIRVSFGGKVILQGVGSAEQILDVASNTPASLASHAPITRVLLTWLQWRGPALDFDYRLSGLGYAWLWLAVPALLALLYRLWRVPTERVRLAPITFVLLLTAACFALQPMTWWSRYTLWMWGAGALAIAVQLELALREGATRWQRLLLWLLTPLALGESAFALAHVHGMQLAVDRFFLQPSAANRAASFLESLDLQHALQAKRWISPEFWQLGWTHEKRICRGEWKPDTDNANLDGVLAQLSPRPSVLVLKDEHVSWADTKQSWLRAGCPTLLLFRGSPVLSAARTDPDVTMLGVRAFDPLYLLRARPR